MKQVSWVLALVVGVAIGFFAKSALVGGMPSRALPPPAAAAASTPSANGKNASEAIDAPRARSPRCRWRTG